VFLTIFTTNLVAAETAHAADPILVILTNGGVIGAVLILSMFGKGLHTDDAWNELKRSNEEKDKVIEQLMTLLQVQVVPAMTQSTRVIQAGINKETALADRLGILIDKLEDIAREEQ
jgi:hypothetical protein